MQIGYDSVGKGKADKIFEFKPWPIGGTTNSLSAHRAEAFGVDPSADASNVRTRKRQGGQLDERGEKRKVHARRSRAEVKRLVKEKERMEQGAELGAQEEDGGSSGRP